MESRPPANYSLDEPYISVYDRPKRPRGRPKIYTDEELKERRKETRTKHKEVQTENPIRCASNVSMI